MVRKARVTNSAEFAGFPVETIRFLRALKRNNDRDWFMAHKDQYESFIKAPSLSLIEALKPGLKKITPLVVASPRCLGRIYRDTRFSEDKRPYKNYISFLFRDPKADKEFSPSFYAGYDPSGVSYGVGIYNFSTLQRDYFRNRIIDPVHGKKFTQIVKKIRSGKRFEFRGSALKRMPLGFTANHPNAEFLLYNGLYVSFEEDLPKDFSSRKFSERMLKLFVEAKPVYEWLNEMVKAVPKSAQSYVGFDHLQGRISAREDF